MFIPPHVVRRLGYPPGCAGNGLPAEYANVTAAAWGPGPANTQQTRKIKAQPIINVISSDDTSHHRNPGFFGESMNKQDTGFLQSRKILTKSQLRRGGKAE